MSQNLSAEDWLTTGFRTLSEHGPTALKAEPLARQLGATKGSFYWHFKDVPAFRAELLALWRARAVTDIIDGLAAIADPKERLRALGRAAATPAPDHLGGVRAEAAIRAWALGDADVAHVVAEVDAARIAYLRDLLSECGAAPGHAVLLYGAYVGLDELTALGSARTEGAFSEAIELVLAQRC